MDAQTPRPIPFDIDYARAQILSLGFGEACAKVAACWLKGSGPDAIATLRAFDANGGTAFRNFLAVYEFDREIYIVDAGEGFLRRVLHDEPVPLEVEHSVANTERMRKSHLATTGRAIRNKRQLHPADGKAQTAEEIVLPLADRGLEGRPRCLMFMDFTHIPFSRFRDDDFLEPAYSASVDLFRH
jgi:hypothetical protein